MKNIRDTDNFLIEREVPAASGEYTNFYVTAKEFSDYIPAFRPGTVCIFFESTAPVSWTQTTDTTVNESIIRLLETGSTGGTLNNTMDFSAGFLARTPPVPRHRHDATGTSHSHSVGSVSHGHGASNPNHSHSVNTTLHGHPQSQVTFRTGTEGGNLWPRGGDDAGVVGSFSTNSSVSSGGGSGSSNMSASVNSSSNQNFGRTGNATANVSSINNASVGSTMNFDVKYNECILCTKDP